MSDGVSLLETTGADTHTQIVEATGSNTPRKETRERRVNDIFDVSATHADFVPLLLEKSQAFKWSTEMYVSQCRNDYPTKQLIVGHHREALSWRFSG